MVKKISIIFLFLCLHIYGYEDDKDFSIVSHLIPLEHPAKPILDNIFQASRATFNRDSFVAAGFQILFTQPRSLVLVARHPLLPGYLVKVQLDDELRTKHGIPFWKWMQNRCEGAKKIGKVIKKKKLKHFKVPNKWIYFLPLLEDVPKTPEYSPKPVILLVEDMDLVSPEVNVEAWKGMTEEHLNELYTIIIVSGGSSYRADNIVLSHDGRFAFIDTEYPKATPDMKLILLFLSPEMQAHWISLFNM